MQGGPGDRVLLPGEPRPQLLVYVQRARPEHIVGARRRRLRRGQLLRLQPERPLLQARQEGPRPLRRRPRRRNRRAALRVLGLLALLLAALPAVRVSLALPPLASIPLPLPLPHPLDLFPLPLPLPLPQPAAVLPLPFPIPQPTAAISVSLAGPAAAVFPRPLRPPAGPAALQLPAAACLVSPVAAAPGFPLPLPSVSVPVSASSAVLSLLVPPLPAHPVASAPLPAASRLLVPSAAVPSQPLRPRAAFAPPPIFATPLLTDQSMVVVSLPQSDVPRRATRSSLIRDRPPPSVFVCFHPPTEDKYIYILLHAGARMRMLSDYFHLLYFLSNKYFSVHMFGLRV